MVSSLDRGSRASSRARAHRFEPAVIASTLSPHAPRPHGFIPALTARRRSAAAARFFSLHCTFKPGGTTMMGCRWRAILLFFALLISVPFSSVHAGKNIYLYDPSVATDIDLNAYLLNGTVRQPNGQGFFHYVQKGPAPSGFPTIDVSERSFEYLGASRTQIDGVIFVNHGNYYVPMRKALVLWTIRIPNASSRTRSEFQSDLTLSLWVDWNQDTLWKPGERMIVKSLNLADQFPTTADEIVVSYLTSFRVPDVTEMTSNAKYGNSGKDIRYMWARALVAYDDADVSPDGDQLFGEYEDYRVAYYIQTSSATGGSR
jgi:hypothetical protein